MENISAVYEKKFAMLPEKVLQFGEGNFLRAFADWYIELSNRSGIFNGSVVIAKPTSRKAKLDFEKQNCVYTVAVRGRENGRVVEKYDVITSVSRFISAYDNYNELIEIAKSSDLEIIISNTTEAGIVYVENERLEAAPDFSYPAKLTALLYERFKALGFGSGLLILPVELIENNGTELKKCVLKYAADWKLGADFEAYIDKDCKFCSTLVDRIVTGFPDKDYPQLSSRLGYEDNLLVACEPYHSFIIEGEKEWQEIIPIHKISNHVKWVNDISPYRERKVRILNGAHTMSVLAASLCGFDIVRDMINDKVFNQYIRKGLFNEIIPTLDLPSEELEAFAVSVLERFDNPFIDHKLLDIALNSVSKFRARCLGSIIDYTDRFKKAPEILSFALAALIEFYIEKTDIVRDSEAVIQAFDNAGNSDNAVLCIMKDSSLWGMDLTEISGLYEAVLCAYNDIRKIGMSKAVEKVANYE